MYNFTSFTVSLNELQTGMEKILAPTDCRLRPDIRSMENGNMGACLSNGGRWVAARGRAEGMRWPFTSEQALGPPAQSARTARVMVSEFAACRRPILL